MGAAETGATDAAKSERRSSTSQGRRNGQASGRARLGKYCVAGGVCRAAADTHLRSLEVAWPVARSLAARVGRNSRRCCPDAAESLGIDSAGYAVGVARGTGHWIVTEVVSRISADC